MFDVFWAPLVSYQRFKFIAKSGQIVAKMWAFISPCAFSNAVLQMQAFNAWQSPNILAHKWGGGGGPPWGEFNGITCKLKGGSFLQCMNHPLKTKKKENV